MTEQLCLADRLFETLLNKVSYEAEFEDEVLKILGIKEGNYNWPFKDYSFDEYDRSFELKDCNENLRLTEEQQKKFWELGFNQCWLNYDDGTERFYSTKYSQGALRRKKDGVYLKEAKE